MRPHQNYALLMSDVEVYLQSLPATPEAMVRYINLSRNDLGIQALAYKYPTREWEIPAKQGLGYKRTPRGLDQMNVEYAFIDDAAYSTIEAANAFLADGKFVTKHLMLSYLATRETYILTNSDIDAFLATKEDQDSIGLWRDIKCGVLSRVLQWKYPTIPRWHVYGQTACGLGGSKSNLLIDMVLPREVWVRIGTLYEQTECRYEISKAEFISVERLR